MKSITGLTATQLIVVTAISVGGVSLLPSPWNGVVFALGAIIGVVLQQRNLQRFHKQAFQDPNFSEAEIISLTRRALDGDFPITQEPSPFKNGGEVLMFEPLPGRKIVIGSVGKGKSQDNH